MVIGVPREIKNNENRVALTPAGARLLTEKGHRVYLQTSAGEGSGFSDQDYRAAGCEIVDAATAWSAPLVLKIKEPLASEYHFLRDQIVFTYFHLAGTSPALTDALLQAGTTAVAYETVRDQQGRLPLLAPMSAVAGNMAATIGSYYLARFNQGKGVQLGRVLGKPHGKVAILGDGVVASHAAAVATSMGARTLIFSRDLDRADSLQAKISAQLEVLLSAPENIERELRDVDLLIGAVLQPGGKAPFLVTDAMVASMEPGSVIVDVSIDQGGCIESSRPTSHSNPVFTRHDVIHYCVTNMPGAYPRTSTLALTDATLPYVLRLAEQGLGALQSDRHFAEGLNVHRGKLASLPVAESLGLEARYKAFAAL